MKTFILIFVLILFSQYSFAKCNFATGNKIDQLSNPELISFIKIETPKSEKFFKNAFKIIKTPSTNIPPKLRKRFKANLEIHYKFGTCKLKGEIRQSGDLKDHIIFLNGKVVRSLDVKLEKGNVLNAVRFKLLIPNTRRGANEILASLILKKAGFIAPETFEVKTIINGHKSKMLFQEKSAKELLERNQRREGPIFEGDESLLWSYKNYDNLELYPLALSRLVNSNWFNKGAVSQEITLHAYRKLQKSYLEHAIGYSKGLNRWSIFPNRLKDNTFVNYHFILIAMNGLHGLSPNNRKYYFNSIESKFEPIYYDGDVDFSKPVNLKNTSFVDEKSVYKNLFPRLPNKKFLKFLLSVSEDKELFFEFSKRVKLKTKNAKKFFISSLNQFRENLNKLEKDIIKTDKKPFVDNIPLKDLINTYIKFQNSKGVDQKIINYFSYMDGYYLLNEKNLLTSKQLVKILSKNKLGIQRAIYIPSTENDEIGHFRTIKKSGLPGSIIVSPNTKVVVNMKKKIINIFQLYSNDWALLKNGNYSSWKIFFNGVSRNSRANKNVEQRFNKFGLTGCLTIYNSKIDKVKISSNNGECEDSLNILNSRGEGIVIKVNNSKADAVDLDFSNLSISQIRISNAENDCLDVSGGDYKIIDGFLENCLDKAISVGEKSVLKAGNVFVKDALIAVSSKDLSTSVIKVFKALNVSICGQVMQKKQEFGGGMLSIKDLICSSNFEIDKKSIFLKN